MATLSTETLRLVLDAMAEGVVLHDAEGRIVWFNPGAARILGPERLAGLASDAPHWGAVREDGSPVADEDHPAMVALRTGRPQRDVIMAVHREGGGQVWMSVNAEPLQENGGISAVVTSFSDVTSSREAGLRLRALETQLRHGQKMEAIGHLTGGIAHDFNNLLTAILTNADLLNEALADASPDAREELNDLRRAARRGADLVRKLMAFSRRDRGELHRVVLADLLYDAARLLRRVVPESIDITTHLEKGLPAIQGDPAGLEQVLMNLATNARDAMPQGGALRIEAVLQQLDESSCAALRWGRPGPCILLAVSDTGAGMDPSVVERVFDPFFTTKPVGSGTGLGMSIVYGIIQQHGAHVRVASTQGAGTTVELRFLPADALAPAAEAPVDADVPGGSETILLVEDNEAVRAAARRVLERVGYRVVAAASGADALQLYQVHQRDVALVLTDVVMPGMGGVELLEAIRRSGRVPRMLLTSGYTDRHADAADLGVSLLPKPWTPSELARRVREVLDGR